MSIVHYCGARPPLASRRRELEDAVERALAALDALDGDADFEASCDDEGFDSDTERDHSDFEASLCDLTFGVQHGPHIDAEGTAPAFTLDHRELEVAR